MVIEPSFLREGIKAEVEAMAEKYAEGGGQQKESVRS